MGASNKSGATGAAWPAIIAIYAWIALELVGIVADLDYLAGGGYDVWFATDMVVAWMLVLDFVGLALASIFVLTWFYRAMSVAHRLTPGLTISPAGAVGWFFVPIAWLWKPYEAMVQIVEGSSVIPERRNKVRELVFWWWGAWIGRSIVGMVLQFMPADGELPPGMVITAMAFSALGIVAAIALQAIIRGVGRLQASHVDPSIFD